MPLVLAGARSQSGSSRTGLKFASLDLFCVVVVAAVAAAAALSRCGIKLENQTGIWTGFEHWEKLKWQRPACSGRFFFFFFSFFFFLFF
ncbi:hypothetical protein IWX47DRAFT_862253, partial [Phyllosticta citricarpa]